jgi:hypothetical protein
MDMLYKVYHIYLHREPGYLSQYAEELKVDSQGSIPSRGNSFSSTPQCPDWLWGLLSLLSNKYWGLFLQG